MTKMLSCFLQLIVIACGQTTTKQESGNKQLSMKDWKTLDHANYSVQYPPDWEPEQSGLMGTSFFLFSPLESDQDKFRENVNMLIQDLTGQNIDLNKYTEISEEQIKTMVTNAALIESKRIKNGENEFHKIIYSGDQGIFHLQFEQYYWVIDDKAFVLTFTSEKDKFADFKETGEKILNSFIHKK